MRTIKKILAGLALAVAMTVTASAQVSLPALDGSRIDIQAQRGKVVVLAIGASWLPLSAKQAEYTNRLAKLYAGRDVAVYFVATDSTAAKSKNYASDDTLKKFANANKLTVPVLRDSDGAAVLKKFNVDQLPSFVILDKTGNPTGDVFGGIDPKFDITATISQSVDKYL